MASLNPDGENVTARRDGVILKKEFIMTDEKEDMKADEMQAKTETNDNEATAEGNVSDAPAETATETVTTAGDTGEGNAPESAASVQETATDSAPVESAGTVETQSDEAMPLTFESLQAQAVALVENAQKLSVNAVELVKETVSGR